MRAPDQAVLANREFLQEAMLPLRQEVVALRGLVVLRGHPGHAHAQSFNTPAPDDEP